MNFIQLFFHFFYLYLVGGQDLNVFFFLKNEHLNKLSAQNNKSASELSKERDVAPW